MSHVSIVLNRGIGQKSEDMPQVEECAERGYV